VSSPLLEVEDLAIRFLADGGMIEAVRGVSFAVPQGRTVALVGESGSGKSVIAQAILGILPHNATVTSGSIRFYDPVRKGEPLDLAAYPDDHPIRRQVRGGRISIIFQEPMSSLSPLHTIGDQISEALRLHTGGDASQGRSRTVDMLQRVGFPDPDRAFGSYSFELSGGLRQRAMIAMALVCKPALLIADEPTTALDVTIQAQILQLMQDLQKDFEMAILFITHDLGVVANMADDVVVLYQGRIMESGRCTDLLERPQHPYLKALLHAVPRLNMKPDERLTPLREIRVDGRGLLSITGSRPHAKLPRPTRPLIEVEGLRKSFRTRRGGWLGGQARDIVAVDDVSFAIEHGEAFGLVGESGCGKTTVSKVVMRALRPDAGQITFDGPDGPVDVLALAGNDLERFRRRLQYIFQDPFHSLNPRMTVYDLVAEPLVIHRIGDEAERLQRVKALLRAVGLDVRHLRRYPHSFSGGQRQRIGIARALALAPEMLICDEPVSALDVSVQAQILNLLKDLQRELNLTYLFISHNLAVVRYVCQRIAVMCGGRIVELAPTETLFDRPVHPYTKALLAAVPEPDLSQPLDFAALMAGRTSEPAAWPAPFRLGDGPTHLADIGGRHAVLMSTEADARAIHDAA
jgi:peptide/nickel transport system ATP-binding protein